MAVDYDLVILGGTETARAAAIAASRWKARIALVEPFPAPDRIWQTSECYHPAFVQTAHQFHRSHRIQRRGWWLGEWDPERLLSLPPEKLNPAAIATWISAAVQAFQQPRSPASLSFQGIDVVLGQAEFIRRPRLALTVVSPLPGREPRTLRSRAYLLACGNQTQLPEIEGLATVQPLLPEDLGRSLPNLTIPASLIVLGGTATALELSQAFSRLGTQVSLVVGNTRLLPQEDPEVGRLIQSQLEAEGITVLTHTEVSQVRSLEGKKWVQAGSRAIAAAEILVATGAMPAVEGLNLEGVGVKWHEAEIPTNGKLQTTQPRIYAIASSRDHAFTQTAIQTVLKNVLLFPGFQFQPALIAEQQTRTVWTDPTLICRGLTEQEARQRYGDRITVIQEALRLTPEAQILGEPSGFVKLILQNRRVLGELFVGHSCLTGQTLTDTHREMLARFRRQRLQQNPLIRRFQESWFDFWRDRTR